MLIGPSRGRGQVAVVHGVPARLVGVQQAGHGDHDVGRPAGRLPAADLIVLIFGENLNILDGGFIFAKITSELGGFAVVLLLGYMWLAARGWKILRQTLSSGLAAHQVVDVLAASSVLSYVVEMFVRGAGYFTPTSVLVVASAWILAQSGPRARAAIPIGNLGAVAS
mgnify:CR=1 FL=1